MLQQLRIGEGSTASEGSAAGPLGIKRKNASDHSGRVGGQTCDARATQTHSLLYLIYIYIYSTSARLPFLFLSALFLRSLLLPKRLARPCRCGVHCPNNATTHDPPRKQTNRSFIVPIQRGNRLKLIEMVVRTFESRQETGQPNEGPIKQMKLYSLS